MTEEDTRITRCYSGKPMRTLNNPWVEAWEKGPVPPLPLPYQGRLALKRYYDLPIDTYSAL